MNITMAIKILEAFILVAAAFCLFVMVFMIRDMSSIIDELLDRIDKANKAERAEKERKEQMKEEFTKSFIKMMAEKSRIHVEDGEPLDFPNGK